MLHVNRKTNKGREVEDILFWDPPGIFHFFTLPLKIQDKTKLHLWKLHKIVLDALQIPRRNQDSLNVHIIFLVHPWSVKLFLWYPSTPTVFFSGIGYLLLCFCSFMSYVPESLRFPTCVPYYLNLYFQVIIWTLRKYIYTYYKLITIVSYIVIPYK